MDYLVDTSVLLRLFDADDVENPAGHNGTRPLHAILAAR
jgi:hypothetical protein